jgi:hypothetical protein
MNYKSKTPTLRDIKVVLGTLGSGIVDALGLSPVPEREPETAKEIGKTYLIDSQLLIVPSEIHSDLASLALDVRNWLNHQNLPYSQPLEFGLAAADGGFLVRNKYDYFTLNVATSKFPDNREPRLRDHLISLVRRDLYPLAVRAPIMEGLQGYLAEPQNPPVSPSTPRAA